MDDENMELGLVFRAGTVTSVNPRMDEDGEGGADDRRLELTFSSEEPYERMFGIEILDHQEDSVRLETLNRGHMPFLADHVNALDSQIGVVEKAWIHNKRGHAVVRMASTDKASELLERIREGIVSNISVGYRIHKMVLAEEAEIDTYRATDWEPIEISLVSLPADPTVGIGRSQEETGKKWPVTVERSKRRSIDMPDVEKPSETGTSQPEPSGNVVDLDILKTEAQEEVKARIAEIQSFGNLHPDVDGAGLAAEVIAQGGTLDELKELVSSRYQKAYNDERVRRAESGKELPKPEDAVLGLSKREVKNFSIVRAIRAMVEDRPELAEFEMEVMRAANEKIVKENIRPQRSAETIPAEVLQAPFCDDRKMLTKILETNAIRTIVAGGTAAGGGQNLVESMFMESSFIDLLRNMSVVLPIATVLSDLVGNLEIPRQTGTVSANWLTPEAPAASASGLTDVSGAMTFDQVEMSPKELGVGTEYSRRMMIQATPDIEFLVRRDFAAQMALALDSAAINGSGTGGAPKGILTEIGTTAGTNGLVEIGDNGGAITWKKTVELETEVDSDNALMGDLCYITNPKVRGAMKGVEKATNTARFIYNDMSPAMPVNGYPLKVSNQIPSNLTKGSASNKCSALMFGNFSDLLVGLWSGIDIVVNPYNGQLRRVVAVTAYQDADIAVRHLESFSAITDITTS